MPRVTLAISLTATLLFCPAAPSLDDAPPVFDKRPYAEAKKAAEDGKKWFIVKATAVWCMPCKQMDKTTWVDEKVVNWLKRDAVVVAVDVDKEPKLSQDLSVEAMPTVIAFKDGSEFDRVVGYKPPDEFLVWLEGIARGEKSIELVKKKAGQRNPTSGPVDVQARLQLARSLAQQGKSAEAADEYEWLWRHMLEHNPGFSGVRRSFMVSDMRRLAARSADAKARFAKIRDETGERIDAERVAPDDRVDWIALNKIVDDAKATLAWYDKVKDTPRFRPLISRVAHDLTDLFIAEKRWADVGRLSSNPIATLEQKHRFLGMAPKIEAPPGLDEATRKSIVEVPLRTFREGAGQLYAGLLAAGRENDAQAFAARARELDSAAGMTVALTSTALEAGQPRKNHVEWLAAISGDDAAAELRRKVEAALEKKTGG